MLPQEWEKKEELEEDEELQTQPQNDAEAWPGQANSGAGWYKWRQFGDGWDRVWIWARNYLAQLQGDRTPKAFRVGRIASWLPMDLPSIHIPVINPLAQSFFFKFDATSVK